MSKEETTAETETPVDDGDSEEIEEIGADEPEPAYSAAVSPRAKRAGGGAIAWLALLFSVVALFALAVDFMRDRGSAGAADESSNQLRTLTSSLRATQDALTSVEQNVSALSDLDVEQNAAIERTGRQITDRLRQLDSLPGRLSSVEASMSAIQGISTGARDAWLLAEAGYYMEIANAQLQLASNPQLASLALTHADERILQLADPRLTNIRQALSDELRALEVLEKPDVAGITLKLASLAGVVESLPLRQEAVIREDSMPTEIDSELTGMDRAVASVKNAVSGIVSVRRADEAMQPLIAPDAQYFLRANLALQLQVARLAILRGEETIFRQSLDDADSWLDEYYDPGSTAVQSARNTIAGIRSSVFNVAMPDISLSLRLLRQFNAISEAAASGAAAANETEADGAESVDAEAADAGNADATATGETDVPEPNQ